jgi:hypothetical protein
LSRADYEEERQSELTHDCDNFPQACNALAPCPDGFTVKDSGKREQFESGMVRDTDEGKTRYWRAAIGPMFKRWALHLGKGAKKYPDVAPGVPNWTLASGQAEYIRFKESAFDHFMQWYYDLRDEDHAAGVFFNINGAEYVRGKLEEDKAKEEVTTVSQNCTTIELGKAWIDDRERKRPFYRAFDHP